MQGFNLQRLQNQTVVAVNDAVLHTPWAVALFSLDLRWIRARKEVIEKFAGLRYLAVPDGLPASPDLPCNAIWIRREGGRRGLSESPETLYVGGGNSGFAAFNLAYLKGAQRIVLLGYDFTAAGKHWHAGYSWATNIHSHALYWKWGKEFRFTLPQLKKRGVEVLNASSISTIQEFPKISLEALPL